jgi:hypoxanthine-DNA glycosylase
LRISKAQTKMIEVIRNRTIRPSTRLEKSKSYKINTKTVGRGDILIVNIDHESKAFRKTFKFNGADVAQKDSISFRVTDFGTSIDVNWSGAQPSGTTPVLNRQPKTTVAKSKTPVVKPTPTPNLSNLKTSFEPIASSDIEVLILGTMPGEKSLAMGEYYSHPRNKFWKIVSTITDNDLPQSYAEKKSLLPKTRIGIWDVAHRADRKGSLDSAIENEVPNDLDGFIAKHKNLKIVGFNGTKSMALFDKYFNRKTDIKYILLPSTSPANTGIKFNEVCNVWRQLVE